MRLALTTILVCVILTFVGCGGAAEALSPVDTLKKYMEAVVNKDLTTMKLLLSEATLKLHTEQAKAQNTTLDEIVRRETMFPAEQRKFNYKPAVIEGDKATVQVENDFGGWDQIFLVKEGGVWKIDKKGTAQQMINTVDEDVQGLDDEMDAERKKNEELLDQLDAESPDASPDDPQTSPLPPVNDETLGKPAPTNKQTGAPDPMSPNS